MELYATLGIKEDNRITIYIVINPQYAKSYAKKTKEEFLSPVLEPEDKEFQNLEVVVFRSKNFEMESWLQIAIYQGLFTCISDYNY